MVAGLGAELGDGGVEFCGVDVEEEVAFFDAALGEGSGDADEPVEFVAAAVEGVHGVVGDGGLEGDFAGGV